MAKKAAVKKTPVVKRLSNGPTSIESFLRKDCKTGDTLILKKQGRGKNCIMQLQNERTGICIIGTDE